MPASPASQLASFLARFTPRIVADLKALRTKMRRRLPHAHELVYNYNHACLISYGPTERPYEAPVTLSAQAGRVSLYFLGGPKLPDPQKLLRGTGQQVRHVTLPNATAFDSPDVESLIAAAIKCAPVPFDPALRPRLIIKSNSAKQLPKRAASASSKAKLARRKVKL